MSNRPRWLQQARQVLTGHLQHLQQRWHVIRQRAQQLLVQTLGETVAGLLAEILDQVLDEPSAASQPQQPLAAWSGESPLWGERAEQATTSEDEGFLPENDVPWPAEARAAAPTLIPDPWWRLVRLGCQAALWWLWYRLGRNPARFA